MARVPANSYGDGPKYKGGSTVTDSSGKDHTVSGEFTSPSGKVSYIDDDGTITTTKSSDKSQTGNVYTQTGSSSSGGGGSSSTPTYELSYNKNYGTGSSGINMQVSALERAMENNRSALRAAYKASKGELESSIGSAKQQAYINSEKAKKSLPQVMAAAGYHGGVTETTGAGIYNEYQNALAQLEIAKAEELARMSANYANGVAQSDSQYEIQLSNALAQAEQIANQREIAQEQLKMQQAAAALEEEKYRTSLLKSNTTAGSGSQYSINQLMGLLEADLISPDQFYEPSGITNPNLEPEITNNKGAGWISLDGVGRVATNKLKGMLSNGQAQGVRNADGSITYGWAK